MLYTKVSFEYDRIMIKISLHTKRAVHVNWIVLAPVVHTSDWIIVVFCAFYSYTWMCLYVQEKYIDSLDHLVNKLQARNSLYNSRQLKYNIHQYPWSWSCVDEEGWIKAVHVNFSKETWSSCIAYNLYEYVPLFRN